MDKRAIMALGVVILAGGAMAQSNLGAIASMQQYYRRVETGQAGGEHWGAHQDRLRCAA
jgi:hypothetical protein